jgi:itaconyl-CoA hydratase
MNFHPLHCDAAYGAKSEFGRCLINSGLTIAIVLGMSVADVSAKAIANLGMDKLKLLVPVFPGDTIYAESEVIDKRESKSRPTQGVVTVRTTGRKADGIVFMTFERSALIPMRGHGVEDRAEARGAS